MLFRRTVSICLHSGYLKESLYVELRERKRELNPQNESIIKT